MVYQHLRQEESTKRKPDSPPRIRTLGLDAIAYELRFRCHEARQSNREQQCINIDSENDRHCSTINIKLCKMKRILAAGEGNATSCYNVTHSLR